MFAECKQSSMLLSAARAHVTDVDLHMQQSDDHLFDDRGVVKAMVQRFLSCSVIGRKGLVNVRQTPKQIHHVLGRKCGDVLESQIFLYFQKTVHASFALPFMKRGSLCARPIGLRVPFCDFV